MCVSVHNVYTDRPGLTHQISHTFGVAHMGITLLVSVYIHKKLLWTNKSELEHIKYIFSGITALKITFSDVVR